jgi:hypothetical protein
MGWHIVWIDIHVKKFDEIFQKRMYQRLATMIELGVAFGKFVYALVQFLSVHITVLGYQAVMGVQRVARGSSWVDELACFGSVCLGSSTIPGVGVYLGECLCSSQG